MTSKTFVLDTNVLLHDPHALEKFESHEIVMPLVVLEELDKLKRFSDELGKNARHVIRFIDQLKGDVFKGVTLDNGSTFSIFVEDKTMSKEKFPLSLDNKKHRIIFAAYQLKAMGREVVIMISKDFVLRIKAESIGIEAQDYELLKNSYENLYKGYRKLDLSKQEIDTFLTKGSIEIPSEELISNEYIRFSCPENSSAFGRFNGKKKRIERVEGLEKEIWGVKALNDEQECAMDMLMDDNIKLITMLGQAGTGKTLMALTCGLRKVFDEGVYNRILISRPIMPLGKDIGYLPGTKEEKMLHWMQPIYDNLEYICETTSGSGNGSETKQWIMESEKIEMEAVTFIRGRSLARTYIIIDEAQNLTPHEVKTIISRAGKGTKVILTGDPTQIDNPYLDKNSNALTYVVNKFKSEPIFGHVMFQKTERSELAAIAAKLL
ncbi:MAG: PhoH family protein [Chlamydiia bacterium]|nr:PhoH family protein [Chlamydiia bacterium]MCB1115058.1 PhoH family protein [Chlamydiia bacterium]